jgi:predicted permease
MRFAQDIRYGVRMLAANPAFAAVAIASLAIGIGATCAIFSFADGLLLRPLPVARPGDVVTVGSTASLEALGASSLVSSYPDYIDVRDRAKSFDGLAAFTYATVGFAKEPGALSKLKAGMLVSGNLLPVMGVQPALGRSFRPEENDVPGRDAVVILGHALWAQEFASDPHVLGRRVDLDGHPFTVVGVAPPEFTGLNQYLRSDFFVPLMMSAQLIADPRAGSLQARDARNLSLKGRLAHGVSQTAAQSELTTIAADLARAYPDTNKNRGLAVRTELQARISQSPPDAMLIAMLATLAIAVLLVACANAAGLLTSRAPARAREMALRLAIGAGRGRLVRQLITESLLLAIVAGVFGLAVGYAGVMLFRQIELPTDLPIAITIRMDERALVFSLVVAVISTLLFGLSPALQASRADLTAVMKAGDSVAPGRRRRWGRALLVGGQVAVSVVVLTVAVFMYRGFSAQLQSGPGYRIDHLVMMTIDTRLAHYTEAQSAQFFKAVLDRARDVPGTVNVTLTSSIPMANDSVDAETMAPEGFQFPVGKDSATILDAKVDEHYFDAMAIPIVRGRRFEPSDTDATPTVAIVNEQFAKHYWPDQDPIGKRIRLVRHDGRWAQVVGVAKTTKYLFIAEAPTDFAYFLDRQIPSQQLVLLAQSAGDPASLVAPMREVVHGLDAALPVYNVRTMETLYQMRATRIFNVIIATVLALGMMGLSLAIVGLYGLVSYAVSRRTREIGIRMAIGADRGAVLRMVLRQGIVLASAGLAVGLLASVGAGELLRAAFPTGDSHRDFGALLIVVPVVLAVTSLAAYIPARRASHVNPMQALRQD